MRRFSRPVVCLQFAVFLLVAAACYLPLASAAVRETSGVLNKGTRFETSFYVQQSDQPGPTVVIAGGAHGDEAAGAAAADQIRCWPIVRGTLAVVPRANPLALAANKRLIPGAGADVNNLNRDYPKAGHPGPGIGEAAPAIWAWIQSFKPDWVLDLHEGTGIRGAGSTSVGSSAIVFRSPVADDAAKLMLEAVNSTIDKPEKKFVRLGPPVDASLARAAGEHLGACAMTLETSIHDLPNPPKTGALAKTDGSIKSGDRSAAAKSDGTTKSSNATKSSATPAKPKEQPLSLRVRQHRLMVYALLRHLGMIDASLNVDQLPGRAAAPDKTAVAIYDAGGTGGAGAASVQRLLGDIGMRVDRVGPEELSAGVPRQYSLVVVPGGSGSKEAAAIGEKGLENIRRFVEQGGGYLGICAGAYLCTSGYDWSLKILDAKTVSPHWARGVATLKIELTVEGRKILGDYPGLVDVIYHNGPIIMGAGVESLPDYEVLAYFRTEVAKNKAPVGVQINSPAIAVGPYGKGRVVFVSPHPEQTLGLEDLVRNVALWAVGKR